jgi:hypothetical protein
MSDAAERGRASLLDNTVKDDEDDDDEAEPSFCTFAVTGRQPEFQAIFVCNECFQEEQGEIGEAATDSQYDSGQHNPMPLCICQACADVCHDGHFHEVDYIGMGPATCDCNISGKCKIHEQSRREAKRLGIRQRMDVGKEPNDDDVCDGDDVSPASMIQEAFEISMLRDTTLTKRLIEQAKELIQRTKETHWVDKSLIHSGIALSELELLAWKIYQCHLETYSDTLFNATDNDGGGAEWWVQVKPLENPSPSTCGIDLHYDKDEALAESFGLASFPALSTVTYLIGTSPNAPPTVVLDHTYTQGEEEVMSQLLVSRPRAGKHLVFDGRLLHGAPYHPDLQPLETTNTHVNDKEECKLRVTFLVNIWNDRRPANVQILDDQIRQSMLVGLPQGIDSPLVDSLQMNKVGISTATLQTEHDLPEGRQERIELSFVSDKGTLGTGDENGLVVVTFPPPQFEDSVLVTFGPGMQAYLEYLQEDDGNEESTIQYVKNQLESEAPGKQSDYV